MNKIQEPLAEELSLTTGESDWRDLVILLDLAA
jgi:hypothetical protein